MKKFFVGLAVVVSICALALISSLSLAGAQNSPAEPAVSPAGSPAVSPAGSPAVSPAGSPATPPATSAPTGAPAAPSEATIDLGADNQAYKAGLWQDGKAVFSDITLLDLFLKPYYRRGYRPEQPIKFSHRLHLEKNQMECQYCHSGVAKSPYATLPSVELCMGCHRNVKTDSEEIKKLKGFADRKEPVNWQPVNNLPEHVHFTHKRHIKAGIGCQNCHGQINKMTVVERVSSLKMGFCVTCHRENGATIDCSACHY